MKFPAFTVRSSALAVAVAPALPAGTANAGQQAVAHLQTAMQAQPAAVPAQHGQGRKEHLATMFLSKGCQPGDAQR